MELDMYLSRHVTVANYDFDPAGQQLLLPVQLVADSAK